MKSQEQSTELRASKTPTQGEEVFKPESISVHLTEGKEAQDFRFSKRKSSLEGQIAIRGIGCISPEINSRNQSSLWNLKMISCEKDFQKENSQELKQMGLASSSKGAFRYIHLPSLIPMVNVGTNEDQKMDQSFNPREKKLLRRRLNSEDEKSLMSNSKMEMIFGGRDRSGVKLFGSSGLQEGFHNPTTGREPISTTKVIYDRNSIFRKVSITRKKSFDLGIRTRTRDFENKNRSQELSKKPISGILPMPNNNLAMSRKSQLLSNFSMNKNPFLPIIFNEPSCSKKKFRKESDMILENENDATKGSSYNTETGPRQPQAMTNLLNHSDTNERNGSAEEDIKSQNRSILDSKKPSLGYLSERGKELNEMLSTNRQVKLIKEEVEKETIERFSRRKASWGGIRKNSMYADKSVYDELEQPMLESNLGSTKLLAIYYNIGSQISEDSTKEQDLDSIKINFLCKNNDQLSQAGSCSDMKLFDFLEKEKLTKRSRRPSDWLRNDVDLITKDKIENKIFGKALYTIFVGTTTKRNLIVVTEEISFEYSNLTVIYLFEMEVKFD